MHFFSTNFCNIGYKYYNNLCIYLISKKYFYYVVVNFWLFYVKIKSLLGVERTISIFTKKKGSLLKFKSYQITEILYQFVKR